MDFLISLWWLWLIIFGVSAVVILLLILLKNNEPEGFWFWLVVFICFVSYMGLIIIGSYKIFTTTNLLFTFLLLLAGVVWYFGVKKIVSRTKLKPYGLAHDFLILIGFLVILWLIGRIWF